MLYLSIVPNIYISKITLKTPILSNMRASFFDFVNETIFCKIIKLLEYN